MTTASADTLDLISELCCHFSRATGWRLQFAPPERPAKEIQIELESRSACCWFSELTDGSRSAGFLHLEPPDDDCEHSSYVETVTLAETLGQVLGQLSRSTAQLKLRNEDVTTLLDLGRAVPAHDDLAFGLSQLMKAAVHLTASRSAAFFLLDATASRLKLRAVYKLSRDEVPQPHRELRSGHTDLRALAADPVILKGETPGDHPLFPKSVMTAVCAAVQSDSVPFGTLWIFDRRAKEFSQRDIHVLQSIATQMAAVLERSVLQSGSEQQERITRDLKAASEGQSDDVLGEIPADPRFDLAARCTSCFELGGDLCEVVHLSDDRTAIVVGDASGNSIPAAMIMSAVRGAIRTYPADEDQLSALVTRLNSALCSITRAHQFMSLCYGVYDAGARTFTYSNAGHPCPLLFRDGQTYSLESHGLLLGVVADSTYPVSIQQLCPGDLLVLYSDGLSEAHSHDNVLFRWEGISAAVLACSGKSAANVLEAVWQSVEAHIQGGEGGDDRTLLVLRVN